MTALKEKLLEEIARSGPIPVAEYMARCLYDPKLGYYATQPGLGQDGDFITAPEISQAFGELLGLALAQAWMDQGCPSPFSLCELGPGNGKLMSDILRATKNVDGFHDGLELHLIENSHVLRSKQALQISSIEPIWHNEITSLPNQPLYFIANEYFDCLPIRQYRKTDKGWQEQMIGADGQDLAFILGRAIPDMPALGSADFFETCPAAVAQVADLAAHIAQFGGGGIIIDYGADHVTYDSLQALQNHTKVDPLTAPGQSDLTAHVCFSDLAEAAKACDLSPITTQGVLLERLGLTARMTQLAKAAVDPNPIINAHRRLAHPDEMGTLFKAIAMVPRGKTMIAGFTE